MKTKKEKEKIRKKCVNKCKKGYECLACFQKINELPDSAFKFGIVWGKQQTNLK